MSGLLGQNDAEFLQTFTFVLPNKFQIRPNLESAAKGQLKFGVTIGKQWGFSCEAISRVVCDLRSDINAVLWRGQR